METISVLANVIDRGQKCGKLLSMYNLMCQPNVMVVKQTESFKPVVRSALIDDAGAIADIYAEHVYGGTASFDTVPRSVDETAQKIADIRAKGWPFLVAGDDNEIAGYAYATQFRDRPAYGFACENSIYVRSDRLGSGIGSLLMLELISASAQFGFRQMIAVIGGGEPASVALHSKMGFEHAGRMRSVGRKFGQWLDSVYMQRALGEGDSAPPFIEP
jgi:L-amino acid N-acyltransferase YncA